VRQRRAQSNSTMAGDGLEGVFHVEGKEWRAQRRVVSPAFSHANMKLYVPSIKTVAKRVVDHWQKAAGDIYIKCMHWCCIGSLVQDGRHTVAEAGCQERYEGPGNR